MSMILTLIKRAVGLVVVIDGVRRAPMEHGVILNEDGGVRLVLAHAGGVVRGTGENVMS